MSSPLFSIFLFCHINQFDKCRIVLICFFLISSDLDPFFIWLSIALISSSVNCSYSLTIYKLGNDLYSYLFNSVLYIFEKWSLYQRYLTVKIVSQLSDSKWFLRQINSERLRSTYREIYTYIENSDISEKEISLEQHFFLWHFRILLQNT